MTLFHSFNIVTYYGLEKTPNFHNILIVITVKIDSEDGLAGYRRTLERQNHKPATFSLLSIKVVDSVSLIGFLQYLYSFPYHDRLHRMLADKKEYLFCENGVPKGC